MIKRLRLKFVCAVMAIIAVMLAGILGLVVHFTGSIMEIQSINMMRAVSARPFQQGNPDRTTGESNLPYFTVQIGHRGEVLTMNSGYFDLPDHETLLRIVDEALSSGKDSGELKEYRLRFLKTGTPAGYHLVFSDTAAETTILKNLVYTCLLIFFVAMAILLWLAILLSHWAVRPVAAAWDQQRQFVADASHELKTPLSVIMANAELLRTDDLGEEERSRFSGNILSTSYQMRSLVDNMLEMARVDNGTVKMHFANVDFSQLVSDAVLSFQLLYEEKGMALSGSIHDGIPVSGSEQHLYQVLDVLLDNGLKYSTPGGTVRVELVQNGRNCILSVSGPGEAISKEDLKNIFKRFYRVDKARAMNGSYGLGLSIAESIVSSHKGRIWAQSADGCNTFFVQLPVSGTAGKS